MRFVFQRVLCLVLSLAVGSAWAGTIEGRVQCHRFQAEDSVVYVDDIAGPVPAPERVVIMDQRGLRFVPHVLAIQVGTTVEFANSDPLAHNVFSISAPKRFNLGLYPRGTVRSIKFDQPGVVQLLCNVHQEMSAFIVIVSNPYFARPAADGRFRIDGVPPGHHRLRCWHEESGERTYAVDVPPSGTANATFDLE